MKRQKNILSIFSFCFCLLACQPPTEKPQIAPQAGTETAASPGLQNGDLIFHTSLSGQSEAIQLATNSPYSHCGILYQKKGKWYVFEAIQPVTRTPLQQWIARGEGGHYVVKRLKNAREVLTPAALQKMHSVGAAMLGKDYDAYFEWDDERIYCSELIWKVYHVATGLELGKLEHLQDFDLSSPLVQRTLRERYGKDIPLEEVVISPKAIFECALLETVHKE